MPEGEKHWGAVLIGGDNLPSPGSNRVNWSAKYLAPLAPPVPASLILIMYFEEFTCMSDVGRQEKYGNFSRYVDDQEMILAFSNNRVPKFINSVISIGNVSIRKKKSFFSFHKYWYLKRNKLKIRYMRFPHFVLQLSTLLDNSNSPPQNFRPNAIPGLELKIRR